MLKPSMLRPRAQRSLPLLCTTAIVSALFALGMYAGVAL